VNSGDSQTFTIAADSGYHIDDVLVDGVSAGTVASYTFNNVTADHTISAVFAADAQTPDHPDEDDGEDESEDGKEKNEHDRHGNKNEDDEDGHRNKDKDNKDEENQNGWHNKKNNYENRNILVRYYWNWFMKMLNIEA